MIKLGQDLDSYEDYKRIIKELLFNGASRDLKTEEGKTPYDLLMELDEDLFPYQMASLKIILSNLKTNMCMMKHRPLKKVKKGYTVLITGILLFAAMCVSFYYGMYDGRKEILPWLHTSCYIASYVLCCFLIPAYLMACILNPGRPEKKYDFVELVDQLLEKGLHLDNICVYCEVLKSETSFHCQICQ